MKQLILLISFFIIVLFACGQPEESSASQVENSYDQNVMSVKETELSRPVVFLKVSGDYKKNLIGTKINVHGAIKNSASIATFKDVIIEVTYYSSTETELFQSTHTIYDYFPPKSTVEFDLKTDNYREVQSIGLNVIGAKAK
jgi:hypothetical protein